MDTGSMEKPGVPGVRTRARGLEEESLSVCGGTGHCTPREAKTNPDPDFLQAK